MLVKAAVVVVVVVDVVEAAAGVGELRERREARELDAVVVVAEADGRTEPVAGVAQVRRAGLRRGGHPRSSYGTGERRLAATSRNRHRPAFFRQQ